MFTIPVSPDLMHHPKTRALARLTGLPRAAAWPKLILFWAYAAQYCPEGDVTDLKNDPAELAFALELPSPDRAAAFLDALLEAGFLDRDHAGRLTIHDWFTQGAGRLLRKQAAERARKRRGPSAESPRNPIQRHDVPIRGHNLPIREHDVPIREHDVSPRIGGHDVSPRIGAPALPVPWMAIERVLSKHGSVRGEQTVKNWLKSLMKNRPPKHPELNRTAPPVCPLCGRPLPEETTRWASGSGMIYSTPAEPERRPA